MLPGQVQDTAHFAANAGIMHHHDRFGSSADVSLQARFINIQGVRPDIGKDRFGSTQGERIRNRDESERRNNNLVSGLDVQQQRRHFQRCCAGRGQKGLFYAEFFL